MRYPARRRASPLVVFAAVLAAAPALAHPDIAVTLRTLFEIRGDRLVALGESWTFDTAYSARLLHDFDTDRDGELAPEEAERMTASLLDGVDLSNYLSQLKEGTTAIDLPRPAWTRATVADGVVTVSMVFTLDRPLAISGERSIALQVRDLDYAAAFRLTADRPVLIRGDGGRCRYSVDEWPEESYFGGLVMPWEIALTCP